MLASGKDISEESTDRGRCHPFTLDISTINRIGLMERKSAPEG
jgi:hypothetical protein